MVLGIESDAIPLLGRFWHAAIYRVLEFPLLPSRSNGLRPEYCVSRVVGEFYSLDDDDDEFCLAKTEWAAVNVEMAVCNGITPSEVLASDLDLIAFSDLADRPFAALVNDPLAQCPSPLLFLQSIRLSDSVLSDPANGPLMDDLVKDVFGDGIGRFFRASYVFSLPADDSISKLSNLRPKRIQTQNRVRHLDMTDVLSTYHGPLGFLDCANSSVRVFHEWADCIPRSAAIC